jgi:hypothetical protein
LSQVCEGCGLVFARYHSPKEQQAARASSRADATTSAVSETPERDLLSRLKRFNRDLRLPLAVLMLLAIWLLIRNLVPVSVVREGDRAVTPLPTTSRVSATSTQDLLRLSAGTEHSLALGRDGTIWAWGSNEEGQLGSRTRQESDDKIPHRMNLQNREMIGNVSSVAAGEYFTVAVKEDGTVWMWGRQKDNYRGVASQACIRIPDLENAMSVSAGPSYFLTLMKDGRVSVWGKTFWGDFRGGSVYISGLSDIIAISAGTNHCVAIKRDGTVWSWGKNIQGQSGVESREPLITPVKVPQCSNVVKVAAGTDFTMALKQDGTVWGWGANVYATTPGGLIVKNSAVPVQISDLSSITEIAVPAFGFSNGSHMLALDVNGTVWSRGFNNFGQLGHGTKSFNMEQTPGRVLELQDVVAIAAGLTHSLALKRDGSVWAWGKNFRGQLGTGNINDSSIPQRVVFLGNTGKKP